MSVTESSMALGNWSIRLRANTPKDVMDNLSTFGHIAILPGRLDVQAAGDGLLRAARYVGVIRGLFAQPEDYEVKGVGMAFWLGDEENKGYVFEGPPFKVPYLGFAAAVNSVVPASAAFTIGSIYSPPAASAAIVILTKHLKTPREMLTYLCTTYTTETMPVEWRVNGDASVDVGVVSSLYPSTTAPSALLVRKDGGRDMGLTTVEGAMSLDRDGSDYTTKVIVVAEGDGGAITYGHAQAAIVGFKDLFGNPVVLTRVISESDVSASVADDRAAVALNSYRGPRYASQLSTDEYDIKGTFTVGDTIYVYDADAGYVDNNNQVMFKGVPIQPYKLRVTEMTWPIPAYWTVAHRDQNGVWTDISDYYAPEQGSTSVTIGDFLESVGGSYMEPLGSRPSGDSSVPNTPVFGTITTAAYQSDTSKAGDTKAQVNLTWSTPTNTGGTTIVDGAYYRIRFKPKFGSSANWSETAVSWGTNQTVVQELTPGATYSFQIRAEDLAVPPNVSAWSATTDVVTAFDGLAPSQPAAPSIAGSRIAVQVTHTLGKSASGTYNLETDLDHLEVHTGASASFTPSAATLLGNLTANIGLMLATIPAVGTFNVETTTSSWYKVIAVDRSGNKSTASPGASATALLIDNAHISDLTVSKVTAGTIGATWIQGGTITTASSGARVELASSGLNAYNTGGTKTVEIKGSDGSATVTGVFKTGFAGGGSPYLSMTDSGDRTTIDFINSTASANLSAFINSPADAGNSAQIGINTGAFSYTTGSVMAKHRLFLNNDAGIHLQTYRLVGGAADLGGSLYLTDIGSGISTYSEAGTGTKTGGQLYLNKDYALLSRQGSGVYSGGVFMSLVDRAVMNVQNTGTVAAEVALFDDESIWFQGKFKQDNANGGKSALFCGTFDSGSASSFTVNYGTTMSTTPRLIYSIQGSSNQGDNRASVGSATGFTVITGNTVALRLNYWAFRLL